MTVRESISRNPRIGVGAAALLAVVAGILIFFETHQDSAPASANANAYFTVDDGKTWFIDDMTKLPPFDKDGKQAVRAFVFRCPDGKQFVGYVQRFTPAAKQAILAIENGDPNRKGPPDTSGIRMAYTVGRQIKRPGDTRWTSGGDGLKAIQIITVKCPDGGGEATMVEP